MLKLLILFPLALSAQTFGIIFDSSNSLCQGTLTGFSTEQEALDRINQCVQRTRQDPPVSPPPIILPPLTIQPSGQIGIVLKWNASVSPNVESYNIYRSKFFEGIFTKIARSTTNSAKDNSPEQGQNCYKVTAVSSSNLESSFSNIACANF